MLVKRLPGKQQVLGSNPKQGVTFFIHSRVLFKVNSTGLYNKEEAHRYIQKDIEEISCILNKKPDLP